MSDKFKFGGGQKEYTFNFMDISKSSPAYNIADADGYLGLGSNNQLYDPTERNFLD